MMYERHRYTSSPETVPDSVGWIIGVTRLGSFGNLSDFSYDGNVNSGLWTSIAAMSQMYRFAGTGDEAARKNAWKWVEGLEFLFQVTGISGLPARTAVLGSNISLGKDWVKSSTVPGWMWQSDTSSDEIVGHMAAYMTGYSLLARTQQERKRFADLIVSVVSYIINNDFLLIDWDGKPTSWGKWSPYWLNEVPDWYDNRGVNSVEILSWIAAADAVSGGTNPLFQTAFDYLTTENGYLINVINAKITEPDDGEICCFSGSFAYDFLNRQLF